LGGIKDDKYGVDEVAYECEAAERADTNEDRAGYDGKPVFLNCLIWMAP